MLQEQSRLFQRILFFADFALVTLAWGAAYFTRFAVLPSLAPFAERLPWLVPAEHVPFSQYVWLLPWVLIAASLVFYFSGLYAPDRALRFLRLAYSAVRAALLALIGVAALLMFYKAVYVSRLFLGLFGLYSVLAMVGLRFLLYAWLRRQRARGRFRKRVLIVGKGTVGKRLAAAFQQYPWMGLEVVGFADDGVLNALGRTSDVAELVDRYQAEGQPIDYVYIALPLSAADRIEQIVGDLATRLPHVCLAPDLFSFTVLNARVSDVDGLPVIHLIDEVPLRLAWVAKRLMDIGLSAAFLIVASPLLLLIALAVKLSSPGPVFYRQQRMSLNGQTFDMLKFRSMPVNAEAATGAVWAQKGEQRATPLGAFLRRSSLDELPQFINVLKGDMSIVGPRPERPVFVDQFKDQIPRYMLKHKVPAGITGWAQVNGWRGSTSLEKRIEYDLYYIQHWSLKLDFKIMLMTLWKGFVNENAY